VNTKPIGWLLAVCLVSGIAQAKQYICSANMAYGSSADGSLKSKADHPSDNRQLFTVDTSTGIVQGDQVLPPGSYTVVYAGTAADGAKLLRNDAARLEVLFIATNAKNPYPFLFTDGLVLVTGTCRPSA
jgi:hypothetical protein